MRTFALLVVAIFLIGCASKVWIYRPVDDAGRHESRDNGLVNIYYGASLTARASFGVDAQGYSRDNFWVGFHLNVEKGTEVELEQWSLILSSQEFDKPLTLPIGSMRVSVYGTEGKPGYYVTVLPGDRIYGNGLNEAIDDNSLDYYATAIKVNHSMPQNLVIHLPNFYVDGKLIKAKPIELELIEATNYPYSMQ